MYYILLLAGSLLAGASQAAFVVPAPGSLSTATTTTPHYSVTGGSWTFYQIAHDGTGVPHRNAANYGGNEMVYNTTAFWRGPNYKPVEDHPSYRTVNGALTARGSGGDGILRPAAVTFKPTDSGVYSWSGKLHCRDLGSGLTPTGLIFGKLSNGNWVDQWETKVGHDVILDLSTVPELRSMPVKNGETMVMVVMPSGAYSSSLAYLTMTGKELTITRLGPVNAVPDFSNIGSNPNYRSSEGEWSVNDISEQSTGFEQNFLNYRRMKWNATGSNWQGEPPLKWGHPVYVPASSSLTSAGTGSSPAAQRKSAMLFKSSRPGVYEMTGILQCEDAGGSGGALDTNIKIGRFTQGAPGVYTWDTLYQTNVPETLPVRSGINLGAVAALRAVTLNSGDLLSIVVSSPANGSCIGYFNMTPANPVSIDRLPVSHNMFTDAPGDGGPNPVTDTAGDKWEAGQLLTETPTGSSFSNPMTWNAGINGYQGSALINFTPSWHKSTAVLTSSRSAGAGGIPYLRFTPARAGVYSWSGQFQLDNYSSPSFPPSGFVAFGRIYNSGTQYQEVGRWSFSGAWEIDAENIPGLDEIALDPGDSLTLYVMPAYHTSFALRMRTPLGNVMIQPGARNRAGTTLIDIAHGMPAAQPATGTVNPSYDEEGNKWQVYQLSGGDPTVVASYVPMVWDSTFNSNKGRWKGTSLTANAPGWYPADFTLNSARGGSGTGGVSSLVFTPAEPGVYSWKGAVRLTDWSWTGVSGAGNIRFGKISGSTYTSLHTLAFTPTAAAQELSLNGIAALQGVSLAAGESLAISLHPGFNSSPALSLNLPVSGVSTLFIRSTAGGGSTLLPVSNSMPRALSGDNPRTVNGGTWKAFEVKNCTTAPAASTAIPANHSILNWNSAANLWDGINVAGGHPTWRPDIQYMTAGQSGSSHFGISALSFTASSAGTYTWEGKVRLHNWTGGTSYAMLIFGKITGGGAGTYTALGDQQFTIAQNGSVEVDMQELSFLAPVTLAAGESLVFAFSSTYNCAVAAELCNPTGPRPLMVEKVRLSAPVDSSDLSRPHLIDAAAAGVPFDKRILGQAGGLKRLPKPGETPAGAPSFAPGILVRGPVGAAEDWFSYVSPYASTTWKSGSHLTGSGYYWARTVLNFMQNLKAAGCVPLLGVDAGRIYYGPGDPSQVLSPAQITALAETAGDYVRYVNYTVRHFTASSPPTLLAHAKDYNLLQSIAGSLADKLPSSTATLTDCVTYWEVGNEPDHKVATDHNYGDAYKAIEARMRAVNDEIKLLDPTIPDLKIGPALGSGYFWNVRPKTMEIFDPAYTGKIDFISIHPYDFLKKILVPYRDQLLASPPANSLKFYNAGQDMERGLRSLRSAAGQVFGARNTLIDQFITRMGRARQNLEVFASEYDPMDHGQIWAPAGEFAGQLAQMTMYNVLANMETLFVLRDQGYNGACWWYHDVNAPTASDPTGASDMPVASLRLYEKLNAHIGDKVIYQYAPVIYHGVDSGDGLRIYATRNSTTGKLSVWCVNLWQERPVKTRLGIRGLTGTPSSASVECLAPVGTTGLGSRYLTWNRPYVAGPPAKPAQPNAVDWSAPQSVQIQDLSDFELDLPPATVTLLLVNP